MRRPARLTDGTASGLHLNPHPEERRLGWACMNCRQPSILGIFVATALGLVACGDRRLDTEKLQVDLEHDIERQTGVKGISVYCPGDVKVKAHGTFTCDAVDRTGRKAPVRVTQGEHGLVYSVHG
jgi:hypothetical protein